MSTVKCLVWDLDDTLWDGVVLEGDDPVPVSAAVETLTALDKRGILHAVASRGEHEVAAAHLRRHGLDDLFTVVEVGWGAKSAAVRRIAETLGIGLDTLAFVDNDPVERAEVAAALPMVRCYPAEQAGRLPDLGEFQPEFVTAESRQRRTMYRVEAERRSAEEDHTGPATDFLASLDLVLTLRPATPDDLARAHELTVRTHQLNTTGWTADMAELRRLCASGDHEVLVASLTDRFGPYGTIGLAISEIGATESVLKLLLMSCRVTSRGVGAVLLDHLVRRALAAGRRPRAEFVPTSVNRIMLVTLRFAGFDVVDRAGDRLLLELRNEPSAQTGHVRVVTPGF
ncbi:MULTISPECIES: HAD-IIIC family phosphatase [Streptomyces]|uniref:HAD-IIIC family phosphatase n=1 Tax=Streptomyces lonegramiae TaxID=3075524 RepID=A0ABU2X6G5_9ACTN|nr:HAD-IIIC family phosphatase [Streptomyces sp. DSM 41529]MDT0541509.1 HAD-IIIC family phosphatase [Streptomyces sp. DSM 41529]